MRFFLLLLLPIFAFAKQDVQEYYNNIISSYEEKNWDDVVYLSKIVKKRFFKFDPDVYFYWGVAAYELKSYEKANDCFSTYLKMASNPSNFEDVIHYKFSIAEYFRTGTNKSVLSWDIMPKWIPAKEEALDIYEEIVSSLPHHDLGARSLFGKAVVLSYFEEYQDSIETLNLLIRRFPKHELASSAFLEIEKVYLKKVRSKDQDPNLLDLSQVNLRKFAQAFPSDPKLALAHKVHGYIEEGFANSLLEVGDFYKRTGKKRAAIVYFNKIDAQFPDSKAAVVAKKKLERLNMKK